MAQATDPAHQGGLSIGRSAGAVGGRWLPAVAGLAGGIVAAGAAGTSNKTLFLGAVWLGTAAGILLVMGISYLAVRPARAAVPKPVLRQLWRQVLRKSAAWGLGAYAFWFLIIEPLLGHVGIAVPMLP